MLHTEKLRARAAGGKLQNPFRLQKVGRQALTGLYCVCSIVSGHTWSGRSRVCRRVMWSLHPVLPERRRCKPVTLAGHVALGVVLDRPGRALIRFDCYGDLSCGR
jgi:hypothetical protein